jgi:hypothetical protein
VALSCDDSNIYVVKGSHLDAGRVALNEQIVGRLGETLGAPVGAVRLVDISSDLIDIQPELSHLEPGLAHGSLLIGNCTDRLGVDHVLVPENRSRFARLAILYGWMQAGDNQLIYEKSSNVVYSVDHGHFFPIGPNWTIHALSTASPATLDSSFDVCKFTEEEIAEARARLEDVTAQDIAAAVAAPPSDWNFSLDERVAMADYLARRRAELLAVTKA